MWSGCLTVLVRAIIAAALDLQKWKTFYGDCEWTEEDVKGLLDGNRA